MIKKFKFVFFFFLCTFFISINTVNAKLDEAISWSKKILSYNPSNHEVNLILNLLYFSCVRSKTTIESQDIFVNYLELVLKLENDFSNRRMNPSRKEKHPFALEELTKSHEKFISKIYARKILSKIYAECVNSILDNHMLSNRIEELVLELRKEIQNLVIKDAMTQTSFKSTINILKTLMKKGINVISKKRGLISDYFWNFLPPLAVATFIEFDKKYNWTSKNWGELLLTGSKLSNTIWVIIESARAKIYEEYYREFYKTVKEKRFPEEVFMISFDCSGLLGIEDPHDILPEPPIIN